jgi:hypothetical protein
MPYIHRIELERSNDNGVHEVKGGERMEPVEPLPETSKDESRKKQDKEDFERATTPFPGG